MGIFSSGVQLEIFESRSLIHSRGITKIFLIILVYYISDLEMEEILQEFS